jgi:hypothetical protein
MTPAEFNELMKLEGRKIDPRSAIVYTIWTDVAESYGMFPDDDAGACIGRVNFARAPRSSVSVDFDDLPSETREALYDRCRSGKTVPYDNRIERMADVISEFIPAFCDDDHDRRVRALGAAQAALDVLKELDATTS